MDLERGDALVLAHVGAAMTPSQPGQKRRHKSNLMKMRKPLNFRVGNLAVEAFGCLDKVGPLWIPNGLHLQWGHRILHLFWGSRGCSITDLNEPMPTIPDPPRRTT